MNSAIFSYFDTETTGFDPYWDGHRVIQAAVLRTRGGEVIDSFDSLVNPGRAIPAETIAIHGITDEMVESAPAFDVVLPSVL
ncbi:MAG: 3'-5' exonuclease, partial [Candidatus Auribacterota bacterium]|nr:3'-5' exonuclease [Candidatus Auribacterota bacterium]